MPDRSQTTMAGSKHDSAWKSYRVVGISQHRRQTSSITDGRRGRCTRTIGMAFTVSMISSLRGDCSPHEHSGLLVYFMRHRSESPYAPAVIEWISAPKLYEERTNPADS